MSNLNRELDSITLSEINDRLKNIEKALGIENNSNSYEEMREAIRKADREYREWNESLMKDIQQSRMERENNKNLSKASKLINFFKNK